MQPKRMTVAETSFQGGIQSAVERASQIASQGTSATAASMAIDAAKRASDKMRNINDYEAFRAMEDLLKRGSAE